MRGYDSSKTRKRKRSGNSFLNTFLSVTAMNLPLWGSKFCIEDLTYIPTDNNYCTRSFKLPIILMKTISITKMTEQMVTP